MGKIKKPSPVKLFIGILSSFPAAFDRVSIELTRRFSRIDKKTSLWQFNYTEYYSKEMGKSLLRQFIAFEELIDPQNLKQIKISTNKLEEELASIYSHPIRPINLDPGYLSLSKVILSTTKDYSHRVYLGDGIYAENTLYYYQKSFRSWKWTYPDYQTPDYIQFFNELRKTYQKQLKKLVVLQ